jgi:hypothetical protein
MKSYCFFSVLDSGWMVFDIFFHSLYVRFDIFILSLSRLIDLFPYDSFDNQIITEKNVNIGQAIENTTRFIRTIY